MKRIREVETEYATLTLLKEEGVGFYVREKGLGFANDTDSLKKFEKQHTANEEINRLAEQIQRSGYRIISDTYYNE